MNLLKSTKPIQFITFVYAVLYALFILSVVFEGSYPVMNAEGIGVYSLFILFIIGFSISWYNKIMTGVIFLIWNIGMWILELFIVKHDGGLGIISGVPLLYLGVLFILNGYKTRRDPPPSLSQQWLLVLRLLLIIYTILYFIFVSDELVGDIERNIRIDLLNWPDIILTGLFLIYLIGFVLSWEWEITAGILFIIWYACLFYGCTEYSGIESSSGPLRIIGLPVFVQGILYLYYYFKLKPG